MELRFTKMHGLGNDFVVIDDRDETWDFEPGAIRWLCDRHFGIGADGVILVRPATDGISDHFMAYYNSDGTAAEMCGNGIRCFAKWLVDRDLVDGDTLSVQTLGGLRSIEIVRFEDGTMAIAQVDMGEPVLEPTLIPADFPGTQVFECPLETSLGTVKVTAVSMGNPHAVIWVDDVDTAPVETLGPEIENNPLFPRKTNVEFAQVVDERENCIRLRVWERGVGETLACGTGACATLVASVLGMRTNRAATIELPGGELTVVWSPDGRVRMSGSAEQVFEGSIELPEEE